MFSQTTPDEHPPTQPPCRWPAIITLRTLAKFHLAWRRLCDVVLFLSSLVEHTLTAVCLLPECRLVANIKYIRRFCDDLNVFYIFDSSGIALKSGWNSMARMPRLVACPLVLPEKHPPTPPLSRWPALTLPNLAKFHFVWRRLCDVVLLSFCLFDHILTTVCVQPEYQSGRECNIHSYIL